MKKIVVTGASGMIGSELVELAVKQNIEVLAVVRSDTQKMDNIPKSPKVKILKCDMCDYDKLPQFTDGTYDTFFHFAWDGVYGNARNDVFRQSDNIKNSLKAIKSAKELHCNKFIFAGSQAEYGLCSAPLTCDTPENPVSVYGVAKYTVTKFGKILSKQYDMQFVSGRILSSYGMKDSKHTLISALLSKLKNGENCDLTDCMQIWDFINSRDAANAFLQMGFKGISGKSYPVGSGIGKPLKEYVTAIYNLIGNNDAKLNFGAIPTSADSVRFLQADISELTKDTGFYPKIEFEDGIRAILEFKKSLI